MESIPKKLNSIYQQANSARATSTHFLFRVTSYPESTFKVMHWQGTEAIAVSYRFTLSLAANGLIDTEQFTGKDATLSIDQDGEMRVIHGRNWLTSRRSPRSSPTTNEHSANWPQQAAQLPPRL
ncbi:MAG: hypothetical protein Q7U91_10630 [Sideroxyarcus sp.]|nr:hypothetical protein [Sideroxyarcus sp.]